MLKILFNRLSIRGVNCDVGKYKNVAIDVVKEIIDKKLK